MWQLICILQCPILQNSQCAHLVLLFFIILRICHMRRGCMRATVCTCSDTQLCFTSRPGCWQRTRLVACLSFSHMRLGCRCGQLFIHLRSPRSPATSAALCAAAKLQCFCQSPAGLTFPSRPSSAELSDSNNQTLCVTWTADSRADRQIPVGF